MLKAIKIENFKKFQQLNLQDFSGINIFVGDNNSGKSTILEAIALAGSNQFYNSLMYTLRNTSTSMSPGFDLGAEVENYFFYDVKQTSATFNIKLNSEVEHNISISTTNNLPEEILEKYKQPISQGTLPNISVPNNIPQSVSPHNTNSPTIIKKLINYDIDGKNSASLAINFNNTMVMPNFINQAENYKMTFFQPKHPDFYYMNINVVYALFTDIVKNKQEDKLLAMTQLFDVNIKDIRLTGNRFFVDIEGKNILIPLDLLGAGIVTIIYIFIHIIRLPNQILLIDEIENGIYWKKFPQLIKGMNQLCRENSTQLFITTHSEDFIDNLSAFDDYAVYKLNPKFDGGYLRRTKIELDETLTSGNVDIR